MSSDQATVAAKKQPLGERLADRADAAHVRRSYARYAALAQRRERARADREYFERIVKRARKGIEASLLRTADDGMRRHATVFSIRTDVPGAPRLCILECTEKLEHARMAYLERAVHDSRERERFVELFSTLWPSVAFVEDVSDDSFSIVAVW